MKKNFLLLAFALIGFTARGQFQIAIHMKQLLGEQPFYYNTSTQLDSAYFIKISRLQYYISEVKLIHDGGQVTPVTDVYFLVTPVKDSILELGTFTIGDLEKIQFSIGVDQAHNHLDPASFPSSHPLSPKNPTMHWGWTAGYRFVAFEGNAGNNGVTFPNNYQIHTVDDTNYRTITLDVEETIDGDHMKIPIRADYMRLLDNINVAPGLISHASTGASKTLINNMRDHVFTGAQSNSFIEPGIEGNLIIFPNPARGQITLKYDFPNRYDLTFQLIDLSGKVVFNQEIPKSSGNENIQFNLLPGIYIASIRQGNILLATENMLMQ